jgi:hypothetical protein
MAAKSKKKAEPTPAAPAKVQSSPPVVNASANKKPKEKEKIHHSQVTKPKKKKVSSKHPLAKNAKKKSALADDIEIDDSAEELYSEGEVPVAEESGTFDVESISSNSVAPTSDSDSIMPESNSGASILTLEVPSVDLTKAVFKHNSQPDGTQRVTASIPVEEVFRSENYEVRISS